MQRGVSIDIGSLLLFVDMRFLTIIVSIALVASIWVLQGESLSKYEIVRKEQLSKRDGNTPKVFELHNGDVHMKVTNWGATILSLSIPDAKGKLADVVLGFDTLTPYENGSSPYFGALVGRVANRIKNAQFTLNGTTYHLPANNGNNTLHGGIKGFDKVLWTAKKKKWGKSPSIQFTYHSYDGEQGLQQQRHRLHRRQGGPHIKNNLAACNFSIIERNFLGHCDISVSLAEIKEHLVWLALFSNKKFFKLKL